MSRLRLSCLMTAAALAAGCGGGQDAAGGEGTEQAGQPAEAAGMSVPSWMTVDRAANTVTLDVVAGQDASNNRWNFNGYSQGQATITVPQGATVTIRFRNNDPAVYHSIGVDARIGDFPALFESPAPVFPGAISSNATDPAGATAPNAAEEISFTAGTAGRYSMVCYVPAHASAGMWVHFDVSADGSVGLSTM